MATTNTTRHDEGRAEGARLVLPFAALDRGLLPEVGGKAANLGELTRAGLPVPPGFCVTTATYALVARGAGLDPLLDALAATAPDDRARLATLAGEARAAILAAPIPAAVASAIIGGYAALGGGRPVAVAVRSSATAEDLPYASFAGQQDTYLNVVGDTATLDATRRCWASLWTDRAVSYRADNRIDPRGVRLAVVVQRLIEARVSGILFTANPLTGKRRQATIDASPGLGKAIVSGAVNPDHFVVDTPTGAIVERRLGDKRVAIEAVAGGGTRRVETTGLADEACLSDEQLRALAALGARVEAHYGAPQDIEWAIDGAGTLWLTQARPITTLFPLPNDAPASDDDFRVYFSFNVAQGVFGPLTPGGIQAFRLIGSAMAAAFGGPLADRYAGPAILAEAASRLYFDLTPLLRSAAGRRLAGGALRQVEMRTAAIVRRLDDDPRLATVETPRGPLVRRALGIAVRNRVPPYLVQALLLPGAARRRVGRLEGELRARGIVTSDASATARLDAVEGLFEAAPRVVFGVAPVFAVGLAAAALAGRLLGDLASAEERQIAMRALPHNPTTAMDLALWALSRRIGADAEAARVVRAASPTALARDYRAGHLPRIVQEELAAFLRTYGHRGVAEIDLGVPRWSEDPTHLLGVLANYLRADNPDLAPDRQFARAAAEARAMVAGLTRRAARRGRPRGALVGFALRRARALAGLRELPKYYLVLLLAEARALLLPVGEELARAGRLDTAEDVFFLALPEVRRALRDTDQRAIVREHRAIHERERHRRYVPRLLLSDGTEPVGDAAAPGVGGLAGTPASAGTVTAQARVILDPTSAHLAPGEILVAPSTDPGWTPLFLTAGGLVMEMGGAMSHGAVVAREYGIPAIVGVAGATERIATGQRITIDGATGTIVIGDGAGAA
jgi:phosphohistidine swiveling domain-containing protein